MASAVTKERAHELIDRMAAGHVDAVVGLLELLVAPMPVSAVQAASEDELSSDEENEAAIRAKAETGPGTSLEDLLAEMGLTQSDLEQAGRETFAPQGDSRP